MTAPLLQTSLVLVVAYAFPWFIKVHGFMILTGTTKIGIQQITSIHTIREILRKLHLFHISYKFVNCIFYHFIITVCYIVHNTNLLLSTRIKYIPHVPHFKDLVFICCMLLSSNCLVATVNLTNKQFLRKLNE